MKIALLILGLMLAGCGGGADQESAAGTEDKDSVIDPMSDQIEKAEAVEDQAMEHKEDIDEAVQEAEDTADDVADDVEPAVDE